MVKASETIEHITDWLTDYTQKSSTNGYVVGVSGGIDSAVVSTLCARTGLPLVVIEMPIHQDPEQVSRGSKHLAWLTEHFSNVKHLKIDLTATYDNLTQEINSAVDLNQDHDTYMLTLSNTRSRLRMTSLYAVAGSQGALVCGTGNKVEDFGVGFFTKYGDGGVDLSPIADLMKSEVYQIGHELGIDESILNAPPTDGLWDDGRTDEDQIGATYNELEWAMRIHEEYGVNPESEVFTSDRQREVWNIYLQRHRANTHKMNPIPVCQLPQELKA